MEVRDFRLVGEFGNEEVKVHAFWFRILKDGRIEYAHYVKSTASTTPKVGT